MELEVKVGPQGLSLGDGAVVTHRASRQGAGIVGQEHAPYFEATARGNVFSTSNAAVGVTVASTNVSPIAAGTGLGMIVVGNPLGSGKNLVVLKACVSQVSGTPGGGIVWNLIKNAQLITATQVGVINANLIGGAATSIAQVWNNTALTGSQIAIMLRPLFSQSAIALGVSGAVAEIIEDGDIVVTPGNAIALAATATGTTHILSCALTWEEVPQ